MTREDVLRALRRSSFPVARVQDLDRPRAALLLGQELVVFATAGGEVAVADVRCPHRGADETILALETQVYREDSPILDTMRPREVPFFEETTEHHVASDRYTLAYRKAFTDWVETVCGAAVAD
jgi:hypothetical protein